MQKTKTTITNDVYFALVRQFPLRRLKSKLDHVAAVRFFAKTSLRWQNTKDSGIVDYLDLLAGLIDQYERASNLKMGISHRTPADVIRHLITTNNLTIAGLAEEIEIGQSNLSEMLSGRRDFSKNAIAKLCGRFGLEPRLFF